MKKAGKDRRYLYSIFPCSLCLKRSFCLLQKMGECDILYRSMSIAFGGYKR